MADEQIVTNIVATSDFSSLIADVQRTTSALSKLQQELSLSNKALANQAGQIQKAFGETLRSTGQFTSHFVTVGSEVQTFGKNLDSGKLKLRDYYRTWQAHAKTSGGLIRDLAKQQATLQNAIVQPLGRTADGLMKFNVHVANGLNEVTNKSMIAKKEMQIFNKVIQDGGVQLINWGKNTQWAGRQLTVGLTVPMAAFGAAAAKAFREADQELVRLTKVYGGIAATSSTDLAQIRKDVAQTAKELAAAYGSSYKDTISLAADIAATGKQGNELLESTKEATRLSVLGEVDRQEAMKATLAIQSAFKQNTTELTESINFLNAVENQTSTSLADLVEAIPKAGPVVKALGGDVQDLALYLTAMREGGINASEGANALKSALASIINPTKVAKEQFMSFGIDLSGIVNKNAGNLTGTILEIQAALETLDPLKKSQAIEQLFGKFQFARMNALFENLGKQGSQTLQVLDLMKASSDDLANVAGRELAQITESASGKYKRAIESLRAELATLGEQFLEIGTFFINTIDGIVKFINKLPGPIKTALGLLGGFTALVGPLIMLTGVFANFFGYAIKGVGHLRALFKGGEGFRLLTPQIIAAEQAAGLMEKTFYSDAQAASILSDALNNLNNELMELQKRAATGGVSSQPTISTIAGTVAMQGGTQRVVNLNSPFLGKPYSREMSHMIPSKMNQPETMFGVVPGTGPVNKRVSNNPQIYMEGDLPKIPGLTSMGGVSTGVVSEEAAKWHSMTAALAMQSKEEIAALKAEVAATGTITASLSDSYQSLLPAMTNLTKNAAAESAQIVAQLQAGKLTVDQARAKIIALNAQVEAAMASTASEIAIAQGRLIDVGRVPLTNQPVVNPATKKSNMKEMFHKTANRTLINRIAGILGVRTSGGGYSVETTIPKRLNAGGYVYTMNDGNIVPGPNVNADVVPAMLTPGEFVVNAKATKQNLSLLEAINSGATRGAGEQYKVQALMQHAGIQIPMLTNEVFPMSHSSNLKTRSGAGISAGDYISEFSNPNIFKMSNKLLELSGMSGITPSQQKSILARLDQDIKDKSTPLTERQFGRHLTTALIGSGVPKEALKVLTSEVAMRFAFPGEGSIEERRDSLISKLSSKYKGEAKFSIQKNNPQNIIVEIPGQKPFKIRHEATRDILGKTSNVSYDKQRHNIPAGERAGSKLAYAHVPLDQMQILDKNPNVPMFPSSMQRQMHSKSSLGMPFIRRASGIGNLLSRIVERPRPALPRGTFTRGAYKGFNKKANQGGIIKMNEGGQVPLSAGYMANLRQSRSGISNAGSRLAGSMGSMPAQMGMSMAAYGAGSAIGGGLGQAISIGGSILPMMIPSLIKGLSGLGPGLGIITKLGGLLGRLTIPGAVITGVFLLGKGLMAWKKSAEDAGKLNRTMFGGTVQTLNEVGIKYKSIADKLKDVNEQLELNKAKTKSAYESIRSSGVAGLNLTIAQLKQGIKDARKNAPETVAMFDKTDSAQAVQLATSLKAQYVALGMSAQEATNAIYTIISASKNSKAALSAITSKPFLEIKDSASAAAQSVKFLSEAMKKNMNAEELAVGIDAVLNNLNAYKNSLVGTKDKFGNIISSSKALEISLTKIKETQGGTDKILASNLEKMKAQNPALREVLGTSESIASVFAKTQLALSGMADKMNIAAMSASQAISAAQGYERIKESASGILANTPIGEVVKAADAAAKAAKSASTSSAMDAKSIDKAIKAKQDLIDKLEEERKLRLKILDIQQQSEDFQTSLDQAQINYQEALAAGDMAQAAQEQLNIKKLSADRERELARAAINDKADAERKKLEDQIEKLQAQKDSKASAASGASNRAAATMESATAAKDLQAQLIDIITKNSGKGLGGIQDLEGVIGEVISKGGTLGKAASKFKEQYTGRTGYVGSQMGVLDPYAAMLTDLKNQTIGAAKSDTKFSTAVDDFVKGVEAFTGKDVKSNNSNKSDFEKLQEKTSKVLNSSPGSGIGDWFRNNFGENKKTSIGKKTEYRTMLPGRKNGGPYQANTWMLIGEDGPEIAKFNSSGIITPNNKLNDPSYDVRRNSYSMTGNATMGNTVYNVAPVINAAPGMDIEALTDIATRKTVAVIEKMNRNLSSTTGNTGRYI
jgi:TP901 family phage tail tape measure protein